VTPLVVLALTLGACTDDGREDTANELPSVPIVPATRAATAEPPGTLIEATPTEAPVGARAWRITYHSTDATGADITVTGLVVAPDDLDVDRPVVSWGHSTTGTADRCAPSLGPAGDVPVVADAVAQGWVVAATDFEGLGSEGAHPYLVGASAGHTMLDVVRAAGQLDASGVTEGSPVALWGFSQGGHAALFAAEQAGTYAPDLDVRGVVAVAAVADTRQFWDRAVARPDQVGVAITMAAGLAAADPALDLADVLTPEAVDRLDLLEEVCIGEVVDAFTGPVDDTVRGSVDDHPDWVAALAANTAGQRPLGVPALVMQGDDDDIVFPEIASALFHRLCFEGQGGEYGPVPGAGHGDIAPEAATTWLTARFDGSPAPSGCL
jgi:hypothetical protein